MRLLGGALLATATLGLSLLTGPASAVVPADAAPAVDGRDAIRSVLWCFQPTDANCIESLEYVVDGEWRTATVAEVKDWGGKPIAVLDTPGLTHEAGRTQVVAEAFESDNINGPEFPAYQFQLQSWPQDTQVLWDPPINRCENGDPSKPTGTDPCWRAPWLAETPYRLTIRTTSLVPIFVQSSVADAVTVITDIPGGRRISLAGKPGPSQWVLDYQVADRTDQFDAVTYEWGGFMTDARALGGSLAECQGLGIATAYSNGNGGDIPQWDSRTGTLSFGTRGFHYGPDGSVYKGRAEIFVPGPLARCMWNVDPRQTARMEVEVYTENGEEAVGTKSIGYDVQADLVKMIAIDFTYSKKQIAARPTPVTVAPGKKACNVAKTMCVSVDRSRKTAKVTVSKIKGASSVVAVALNGNREDGRSEVTVPVKKGKASVTVKLAGAKSKGRVWVLRTSTTFISSFQIG